MKTADFDYHLPENLIAKYPLPSRSGSRLMVLNREDQSIEHRHFSDLPEFLHPNDLLVFNNSRVIPARVFGQKETGGQIEILVERLQGETSALAHIRSSKSPKPGARLICGDEQFTVTGREGDLFCLESEKPILPILEKIGHMPLPPYIDRPDEDSDLERYQTVYAKYDGSVAAPTAGLHFDDTLMAQLPNTAEVTLHVGAGTFQPVRVDDVEKHHMHAEWIEVPQSICDQVKTAERVIAVGTTSVRSLETASASGQIQPFSGDTDIFIYPGYEFKTVGAMVTNFHLPQSTLLMLISAFAGKDFIMRAYQEAIEHEYRFFSYGDAMLIL